MRIILILFLLIIPVSKAEIIITEIMANPIEDETLNEWIEIYNNGTEAIDIEGWMISDESETDKIEGGLYNKKGTIIPPQRFALITDEMTRVYNNFNVSSGTIPLYVDDSSIGNGLRNSGEKITLSNRTEIIQEIEYPKIEDGKSWSYFNNSWTESEPTPGFGNIPLIGCDWAVKILSNQTFTENPTFYIKVEKKFGNKSNITLKRVIYDSQGKTIKKYQDVLVENALNYRTYKYSPALKQGSSYTIKAQINNSCDINSKNDLVSKTIFINQKSKSEESSIEIVKFFDLGKDKKAKWGQTIKVKLKIYKGNTNKKTINLWLENKKKIKASKQSKVNIETKYSQTELTIPIQIKPNCNRKISDGEFKLVVEGLDIKEKKRIIIQGCKKSNCEIIKEIIKVPIKEEKKKKKNIQNYCKTQIKEQKKINKKEKTTDLNTLNTTRITATTIYESKDQKAKKVGVYMYITILIILTIAIILKK